MMIMMADIESDFHVVVDVIYDAVVVVDDDDIVAVAGGRRW